MRIEKVQLVQKVRDLSMKGISDAAIAKECSIATSTVWKYRSKNILGEPVFYPTNRVKRVRALKVIALLRDKYKMTFASTLKFLNSIGFRISRDTLKGLFNAKAKARQ